MPIEIRELVITAQVKENKEKGQPPLPKSGEAREKLIKASVEHMMQLLKDQQER